LAHLLPRVRFVVTNAFKWVRSGIPEIPIAT
jgi:hypothetical protein